MSEKPWKAYNATATGARPGLVPTLTRTLLDGSKRSVKFDGVQGDTLIDRKTVRLFDAAGESANISAVRGFITT